MGRKLFLFFLILSSLSSASAQENKMDVALYDGIVVSGYVNEGGYLNFTGPNINTSYGASKFILGMLPSLRFKEDSGSPKNAFVFPTLGFGFTYSYKVLAIQIPFYYNAKTAVENGKWYAGIGLGLRLNKLHKNK